MRNAAPLRRVRLWRLRRAERALRDFAWYVDRWGYPGAYPSQKDAGKTRLLRLVRKVHRLGGDPRDVDFVKERHVHEALNAR